jgi:NAD(P)-dependent dehydrogenase (short-subunit alcohol dehydrogenase family)
MDTIEGAGVVVTGGASGIGLATARELGRRDARVVLADVEVAALDLAVASLEADGVTAFGVPCDVARLDDVLTLADEAFRRLDRVHVVFNNAGIALAGPVAQVTHDDWRWVLDVDLWGPIHGVEAFLPRLIEQGEGGHLLFTSSFAGLVPNVGLGPYCVAKYGVVALGEVLARELRGDGIGVSILCPMIVDTNIGRSGRNRGAVYGGAPAPEPPGEAAPLVTPPSVEDVLDADDVAGLTVDAILANRLYVLPHRAALPSIRRRFERIEHTFSEQSTDGWPH